MPKENGRGISISRERLLQLLEEIENSGIPSNQILLGGFSQGAVMSLEAGLRFKKKLCGIIALSGYLHAPERLSGEKSLCNAKTPILICHGEEDDVLPLEGSREAARFLEGEGYPVSLHEYPIGHQVIPEELGVVRQFVLTSLQQALFPAH
jgi:phospholipase/carboxylesterase